MMAPSVVRTLALTALALHLLAGPALAASEGGGGIRFKPGDELSEQQRREIRSRLAANLSRLEAEGRLPPPPASLAGASTLLAWPLAAAPWLGDFGVHGISNFIDEDPAFPGLIRDYQCGGRSYDTSSGYNHRGTDIFTWPFAWNRVDADAVFVVAGADGVILGKDDGNFDRNCSFSSGNWNAVYVRHADGSVAWYGHLKNGSLIAKTVGEPVAAGEILGVVASSGSSTGPHLHLELYDPLDQLIDPWQGSCNLRNPDSGWLAQRPYYDSAINKLMTGNAAAVLASCPDPDLSNESRVFAPGDTVWFTRFYRDQLETQASVCTVYRPDRSVFATWTSFSNAPHYAASWWWNSRTIGASEPLGEWSFEVDYEGTAYALPFWLQLPGPWLLRNAEIRSLAPLSSPLGSIFASAGDPSLDLLGQDQVAGPGEGDDDDAWVPGFAAGAADPDPTVLGDASRPLVFYQLSLATAGLKAVKNGAGGLTLSY